MWKTILKCIGGVAIVLALVITYHMGDDPTPEVSAPLELTPAVVEIQREERPPEEISQEIIQETEVPEPAQEEPASPEEPEIVPEPPEEEILTCTLTVSYLTVRNNLEQLDQAKVELIAEDGMVYPTQTVTFEEGDSVFDVLLREMKGNSIHFEYENTPLFQTAYIEGIANLYEFDCGPLSGWVYKVNGWSPNYGVSEYLLQDGDEVEILYTCDLGLDVGASQGEDG